MRAASSTAASASAHAVLAAEEAQVGVVQRLHAQRDAVDARRPEAPEPPGLDRGRVRLQRDLDVVGEPANASAARSITAATVAGAISEGVPPPKKIEPQRAPGVSAGEMVELGHQRPRPARMVDAVADMAVEVAVGALGLAERPVDVEREAAVG